MPAHPVDRATVQRLNNPLVHPVNPVYWIGGGSASGKSTIARRIAAKHNLKVYATDDVMDDHARRSSIDDSPLLHSFMAMDMDQRWVNRSPKIMLDTFQWFRGEGFNLIIDDVTRLSREQGLIVEGFRLLPNLVKPFLSERSRAVWLLPTPEFRQAVVESRGGSAWGFLAKTSDPERALSNLLERDRMFTNMLREETTRLGLQSFEVDTSTSEEDLAKGISKTFGF
jgi:hypothetical protein